MDHHGLDGLAVFITVAESDSFADAGAKIGLSRSAVSLAIRQLETRLGVPLFSRTTRSVGLTEAGQRLYSRTRPLLTDLLAGLAEVSDLGEGAAGTLRISVPRVALSPVIEPVLSRFAQSAPRVTLDLVMDDGFVDLSADGFDAGIRLGEQVDADMIRRRITGPIAWQIVASPDYLARCGTPTLPEELINHNCITYRFTSSAAIYRWELVQGARTVTYSLKGALVVNDAGAKCTAARQGLGLAYDLKSTFADDVARGALVPVLERFCQVSEGFFLYYPARRQVMPKLRAFIDVVSRHQFSL